MFTLLSTLSLATALAAEPVVTLPTEAPPHAHSGLHRAGMRTVTAGAITTAAAIPAGFAVAGILATGCSGDHPDCMGPPLFGAATIGIVGVAGITTMVAGSTMLVVDGARRDDRLSVGVGVTPGGLVVAGRF